MPFCFDVHALFFADDVVTVETKLHQAFAAKRVKGINLRREFFYATPEEVLKVLKSTIGEVVQYTAEPEAEEFRSSQGTPDVALSIRENLSDRLLNRVPAASDGVGWPN